MMTLNIIKVKADSIFIKKKKKKPCDKAKKFKSVAVSQTNNIMIRVCILDPNSILKKKKKKKKKTTVFEIT